MKKPVLILSCSFPICAILSVLYYIKMGSMVGSVNDITVITISIGITQFILGIFIGKQLQVKDKFQIIILFIILAIISIGISGIMYTILYQYVPNNFQNFSLEILITAAMFSIVLLIIPILLINGLILAICIFLFSKK